MIYTKTGDKGTTSLVGGKRVPKCCDRLESYGTIDELNSHIGMLAALCKDKPEGENITDILATVQQELFAVGGYLATDTSTTALHLSCIVTAEMVLAVEKAIDDMDKQLQPLRSFIIPGGTVLSAQAHICRTVCRRAERSILRLADSGVELDENVLAYINRLSDFFFVLARFLAL